MTAVLYTQHFAQFFDNNGDPLAGGLLYTYAAGTTTPKATYTTAAGTVEHANPIELDASGRAIIFLSGSYKFVLHDSDDNPVDDGTTDNVTSFTTTSEADDAFFQTFSGNNSQTAFTLSEDLGTDEKTIMVFVDSGLRENVTNGSFATDTSWTKGAGWTIAAGVATATGAISTALSQTSAVTVVAGQAYAVTYTITRSAGGLIVSLGGQNGTERTASGTYREVIVAGSTQTIAATGNAFTGTLDDFSITPADGKGFEIQSTTAYTLSGTTLTFASAPPTGTNNIMVWAPARLANAASAAAAAADTSATNAAASAAAALVSENNAAASEVAAALQAAKLSGTSTTSVAIGTGAKSFTTQADKYFLAGAYLLITSDADPTNYMHGYVSSYSGTSLLFVSTNVGGSGTFADWTIRVSGTRGATGAAGGPLADGDYGDITVSSSGTVWNIDAGVVGITELASALVVTESETIAGNDNDTTIPTCAAVKDYADGVKWVYGAAQGTTSGNAKNVTSLPAGVTDIEVYWVAGSTNGTGIPYFRLRDAGGLENTGYNGTIFRDGGSTNIATAGTDFPVAVANTAATVYYAKAIFTLIDAASFLWSYEILASDGVGPYVNVAHGTKALSATLDGFSLLTADTFDAGNMYHRYRKG